LRELNISFNKIKKRENLDYLTKLIKLDDINDNQTEDDNFYFDNLFMSIKSICVLYLFIVICAVFTCIFIPK